MIVQINKVELSAQLAENALLTEYAEKFKTCNTEQLNKLIYVKSNNELYYNENAQDIFGKWYDYYQTEIEKSELKGGTSGS